MSWFVDTLKSGASGIVQGVGNALFGGIQQRRQKDLMQEQARLNEEAAEKAFARQKEMYQMDYDKHTYSAMRKQMEDAGLSPGLLYGGGGTAGVGGGGTGAAPQGGVGGASAQPLGVQKISPTEAAQAELMESQADYYKSLTKDKDNWISIFETLKQIQETNLENDKLKAEYQNIINKYEPLLRQKEGEERDMLIQKLGEEIIQLKETQAKTKAEKQAIDESVKLIQEQTKTEGSKRNFFEANAGLASAKKETEDMIREYRVSLEAANVDLVDAETNLAKHRAEKVDKEIEKLGKDMQLTDEQIRDIKSARARAWAQFGVDVGKTVSQEARGWVNTGASILTKVAKFL